MKANCLRAGVLVAGLMALCANAPARAQDDEDGMRHHEMRRMMMRHEMHREMRHELMRHEMRRDMHRHMMHRMMRDEMHDD